MGATVDFGENAINVDAQEGEAPAEPTTDAETHATCLFLVKKQAQRLRA